MKNLILSLVHSSRKLRPCFQAHPIRFFTYHPLLQVLAKQETSGRLIKWAVELGQLQITYHPRTTIKGQALADFKDECTGIEDVPFVFSPKEVWKLYVDDSATENASKAGIILSLQQGTSLIQPLGSSLKLLTTIQSMRPY